MTTVELILSIITTLFGTGFLAQFLFYRVKKRKGNAEAEALEQTNEERKTTYLEKRLDVRDMKIDELYRELRAEQKAHMKTTKESHDKDTVIAVLDVQKCTKRGCATRTPPSDY